MERPRTIDAEASVEEALALEGGSLIVLSGKTVAGVISDHDLRTIPEVERAGTKVTAVLRTIPSLAPDDTVKEAANVLRSRGAECVPVVDDGKLAGLLSVSRLLELIGRGALHVVEVNGRTVLHARGQRRQHHEPS
jgi:Predicted transcriptional regulator, contains C-terminal CBS domains